MNSASALRFEKACEHLALIGTRAKLAATRWEEWALAARPPKWASAYAPKLASGKAAFRLRRTMRPMS
jgi:hypothetical protein